MSGETQAPFTPTTEQVRDRASGYIDSVSRGEEFDRWLDAHDAQVRAEQAEADAQIAEQWREGRGADIAAAIRAAALAERVPPAPPHCHWCAPDDWKIPASPGADPEGGAA